MEKFSHWRQRHIIDEAVLSKQQAHEIIVDNLENLLRWSQGSDNPIVKEAQIKMQGYLTMLKNLEGMNQDMNNMADKLLQQAKDDKVAFRVGGMLRSFSREIPEYLGIGGSSSR